MRLVSQTSLKYIHVHIHTRKLARQIKLPVKRGSCFRWTVHHEASNRPFHISSQNREEYHHISAKRNSGFDRRFSTHAWAPKSLRRASIVETRSNSKRIAWSTTTIAFNSPINSRLIHTVTRCVIDRRISRLLNLPSVFQAGKRVVLPGLVDCVGGCLAIGRTDRFLEGGKLMTKGRVNEGRREDGEDPWRIIRIFGR